jgi:hypothetical protein
MKKIVIILQLIVMSMFSYSQNISIGTDIFGYGNNTVNHYGLGWYVDPATHSYGPMAYLSAYGGLRFFTMGQLRATLDHEGNFGLGVDSPTAKLEISNSFSTTNKTALKMFYKDSWGTAAYASQFRFIDIASTEGNSILQVNGYGMGIGYNPPNFDSSDRLYVNGNVGIGTTETKGYKFAVNGNAIATSMTIKEVGNWPDYVFASDHQRMSLAALDDYIKLNGHLPGVPTAKEVEDRGVDLGKLGATLLEKLEEMSLHLIDLKKENDELKKEIGLLKLTKNNN